MTVLGQFPAIVPPNSLTPQPDADYGLTGRYRDVYLHI